MFVEPLNAQLRGQRKRGRLDRTRRTRRTTVTDSLDLCWAFFGMGGSGAFLSGHGGDQKLTLFVPNLDPAMASKHKAHAGPSKSSKISATAANRSNGGGGRQRTLSSFMHPRPKVTQLPPQLSPTASCSPSVKADVVSSTSGRGTDAGDKRKKVEVIDLKSDEEDPPLKRRRLSVDSTRSRYSYQPSKAGEPSVAKHLASRSPSKWSIPNLARTTPFLGSSAYSRRSEISSLYSPLFGREHSALGGPSEDSSLEDGPNTFIPGKGHGVDSSGVDMESDVVPCSQDELPLAFPPLVPTTRASPLQAITPFLQPNSLFLSGFTPKRTRTLQHSVPSSATPSDLKQSYNAHIEPIEAPPVPVFTPYSPGYKKEWSQTSDLLPPASFPRCALPIVNIPYRLFLFNLSRSSELSCLSPDLIEEDGQVPFPALPHISEQDDRMESSQIEESFEFAFHIPPPPLLSRKPLRRRTPRVSVDGTETRNLWSDIFDTLAATQKSDPTAAQSPRKRAASSPITERLLLSEAEGRRNEDARDISHEQSSFHSLPTLSPTKPSWLSHTPQPPASPLRLLQSQTSNQSSASPTKRVLFPSPSKQSAFPSPSKSGPLPSSSTPFTIASPSRDTPSTSLGVPLMTPKHQRFQTAPGPDGTPSTAFGLAYVSPPKLPYLGGSTPASQVGEGAGVSQYPESLADEPLPEFLLAFGESQGMDNWIREMKLQG